MATERKQSSGPKRGKKSKHSSPFVAIKEFNIPTHSWAIKSRHLKHLNIKYCKPEHVQRMGRPLLRMTVMHKGNKWGYLFVPVRYEELWRQLRYSVMYWEKAWRWYEERLSKVETAGSGTEAALKSLRKNAGVKLVQYMVCQRKILEELMGLQFDGTGQFSLPIFMEFGIRHFRDWLHDSFEFAQAQGKKYLAIDPTLKSNMAKLKVGYHGKIPGMEPPRDDSWWTGEFDLTRVFSKCFQDALDIMTGDEFEDYRIELADEGRQPQWLETHPPMIVFFTEAFDDFLSRGKDPRDHPKDWLAFYYKEMGDLATIKADAWAELAVLLGDKYWKHERMWDDRLAALGDEYSWREFVDEVLSTLADQDEEMRDRSGDSDKEQDKVGSDDEQRESDEGRLGDEDDPMDSGSPPQNQDGPCGGRNSPISNDQCSASCR